MQHLKKSKKSPKQNDSSYFNYNETVQAVKTQFCVYETETVTALFQQRQHFADGIA